MSDHYMATYLEVETEMLLSLTLKYTRKHKIFFN